MGRDPEEESQVLEPPRLTPADAAEMLGVGPTTITAWADRGVLPCFRTPGGHRRFRRSDVLALLEKGLTSVVAEPVEAEAS